MIQFEEITTEKPRELDYMGRMVNISFIAPYLRGGNKLLPKDDDPAQMEVFYNQAKNKEVPEEFGWIYNLSVMPEKKERAVELSEDLWGLLTQPLDREKIASVLNELKSIRIPRLVQMEPRQQWEFSAYQLAVYHGNPSSYNQIRKKLVKYRGDVLEAMCGHQSYFNGHPGRMVTLLDYCRESLLRIGFPDRRKVCCDLNQTKKHQLLFFRDGEFDVVSICFGFKYPKYIGNILKEFFRVLKSGGKISFVENPTHEYKRLCKRKFTPERVKGLLLQTGFVSVTVSIIEMPLGYPTSPQSTFYHIEGSKP